MYSLSVNAPWFNNLCSATVIAKIPFDSGWLTGKYDAQTRFEGVRSRWSQDDIRTRAQLVDRVREIIGDEATLQEAALGFCKAFDAVSTVIPGAISEHQLRANRRAIEFTLDRSIQDALEAFYREEVEPLNLPW